MRTVGRGGLAPDDALEEQASNMSSGMGARAEFETLREALVAAQAVAAEVVRIQAINADLEARNALLELQNEKMRRILGGRRSNSASRALNLMELALEECEPTADEDAMLGFHTSTKTHVAPFERNWPSRGPMPKHLPRERVVVAAPGACPCCSSHRLCTHGEDISEAREVVPRRLKGIQTVRETFSCSDCKEPAHPATPFQVTPQGLLSPGILQIGTFDARRAGDRQRNPFDQEGADLILSTLSDRDIACTVTLTPLYELIEAHVLAGERLHGGVRTVLVKANSKTSKGRIWTYMRDDRPFAGPAAPAAILHYSGDRWGEHPVAHLRGWAGILQTDAYVGNDALFQADRLPAPLIRAFCWSHFRRLFFELADVPTQRKKRRKKVPIILPLAVEAIRRIDVIFDIERAFNGRSAQERLAFRQRYSAPLVGDLEVWIRENRSKLSKNNDVAEVMDYMLKAWPALITFLEDGRICLTNTAVERILRGIAPGRKSWQIASSHYGGQRTAFMLSLIASAKLNNIDAQAWLADVLTRVSDLPRRRLHELLPWNWKADKLPHEVEPSVSCRGTVAML